MKLIDGIYNACKVKEYVNTEFGYYRCANRHYHRNSGEIVKAGEINLWGAQRALVKLPIMIA